MIPSAISVDSSNLKRKTLSGFPQNDSRVFLGRVVASCSGCEIYQFSDRSPRICPTITRVEIELIELGS